MLKRFFKNLKGSNSKVNSVYEYIVNNINEDLQFWETNGGLELHNILLQFSTNDFLDLQSELGYWNETEQNILTDCVAYGIDGKFQTDYDDDQRLLSTGLYSKLQNVFTHPEYKKWKKDFRVNSKTRSNNKLVKELYDIILRDENTDDDYWFFVGADHFLKCLGQCDEKDFQDLVADIPNWTEDQQYILNECITARGIQYDEHRQTIAFEYQSDLLPILFSITNDDQIKNDIFEHAELITVGKPKPYELLMQMKAWADNQLVLFQGGQNGYKPTDVHHDFLKQAIDKAYR